MVYVVYYNISIVLKLMSRAVLHLLKCADILLSINPCFGKKKHFLSVKNENGKNPALHQFLISYILLKTAVRKQRKCQLIPIYNTRGSQAPNFAAVIPFQKRTVEMPCKVFGDLVIIVINKLHIDKY